MEDFLATEEDAILLHRIREGEHRAFTELVTRHSDRFYRLAYRFTANREDAQDIVQEAFMKLWAQPSKWDKGKRTKFTTWFYRVVMNLCIDHIKRMKHEPLPEDMDVPSSDLQQDLVMDNRQTKAHLERLLSELPTRQQMALNLCFYEGVSNKDAAEIIGVSLKALQSLLMRAKQTLKEKMAHHHKGR